MALPRAKYGNIRKYVSLGGQSIPLQGDDFLKPARGSGVISAALSRSRSLLAQALCSQQLKVWQSQPHRCGLELKQMPLRQAGAHCLKAGCGTSVAAQTLPYCVPAFAAPQFGVQRCRGADNHPWCVSTPQAVPMPSVPMRLGYSQERLCCIHGPACATVEMNA
eukprot:351666-Chlamydomonas_euryale.AAC.6